MLHAEPQHATNPPSWLPETKLFSPVARPECTERSGDGATWKPISCVIHQKTKPESRGRARSAVASFREGTNTKRLVSQQTFWLETNIGMTTFTMVASGSTTLVQLLVDVNTWLTDTAKRNPAIHVLIYTCAFLLQSVSDVESVHNKYRISKYKIHDVL